MGILKRFASDTVVYGLGKGLKKMVGLIMIPFYTQVLSIEDYGILETLATTVWLITIIFTIGLDSASEFYYFKAKEEKERGRVLFTVFVLQAIMVVPAVILALFSTEISVLFFDTPDYEWAVFISFMIIPVNLIMTEQTQLLRYHRQPWHFNLSTLIKTAAGVGLGIYLVLVLKHGVLGVQITNLVSSFLAICGSIFLYSRRKYTYEFSWALTKKMVRFGFPLIWAGLGLWIYSASDRFFLIEFSTLRELGLYSIGTTFSQPILLINMAVQMSVGVFFFSTYYKEEDPEKPETKHVISEMFRAFIVIVVVIGVGLSVFGTNILILVTTPDFVEGALVIPFLTFSFAFAQAFQLTSKGIVLEKKNWYFTWLIGFTAVLNLVLNYFIIPVYGFMGAAASTLFCNFFYWIVGYYISQRFFNAPFRIFRVLIFLLLSFSIAVSIPILELIYSVPIHWTTKCGLLLIALILPFGTGLFSFKEFGPLLKRIKGLIK